jgi:transposase-like protein
MINSALSLFETAAARFEAAQAAVLQEWALDCGCTAPGLRLECQTCPANRQLRLLTQLKLSATPATEFPTVAPLPVQHAYSQAIWQQALALYAQGVPLADIQQQTGVADRHTIRHWARCAGLPPRLEPYPPALRQQGLRLYQSGLTPKVIESIIGVPADTIGGWAQAAGVSRPSRHTDTVKEQCLALYLEGQTPNAIQAETGVGAQTIRRWVAAAKISRSSGRPRTYPESVRQQCRALSQAGQDCREIEALTGVAAETVQLWLRQTPKSPA